MAKKKTASRRPKRAVTPKPTFDAVYQAAESDDTLREVDLEDIEEPVTLEPEDVERSDLDESEELEIEAARGAAAVRIVGDRQDLQSLEIEEGEEPEGELSLGEETSTESAGRGPSRARRAGRVRTAARGPKGGRRLQKRT